MATDLAAPQTRAIYPTSLGMSFCLDLEAISFESDSKIRLLREGL